MISLISAMSYAQPRYAETKIQQLAGPDYSSASHRVKTEVLARAANSYTWELVYSHDTLVKRFKNIAKAQAKELSLAKIAGKKHLASQSSVMKDTVQPVLGIDIHDR
ncbi:hypothetical protein HYN49_10715 [Flavobacterium pallidum]|uniref:Uncharacterized protein n=2 Tax=Flavobacterium pallidum TaxID=2172098 RepID=A0A2S1SIX1_9FLAO|nr:hypothetical protein HYN49_10715 [Flavobacterium pallidum]